MIDLLGINAKAKVIGHRIAEGSDGNDYNIRFRFEVKGREIEDELTVSSNGYQVVKDGDFVDIRYLQNDLTVRSSLIRGLTLTKL
jgi:hypothetical protein